MNHFKVFTAFIIFAFAQFACVSAPQKGPSLSKTPLPPPQEQPKFDEFTGQPEAREITLIFTPHPDGDFEKIREFLFSNPNIKLTLLFPPHYLEQGTRRTLMEDFRVFHSSGQIEIGLTLDQQPVLPLLTDLKQSGGPSPSWDFSFTWPEDVEYYIARASAIYQKRWGELPHGFFPPYAALSSRVMDSIRRFRMNWVIGRPNSRWGVKFFGGTALLVPDIVSTGADFEKDIEWISARPFVLIDGSRWENPKSEISFLSAMQSLKSKRPDLKWLTVREFTKQLRDEYSLPKSQDPFEFDYTPWVSTHRQRQTWQAIAEARTTLENYKNSGRANLQKLDAAMAEMAMIEDGNFLLNLGQNPNSIESEKRNFLATLSNIYRLCGVPVPSNQKNLFLERSWQKSVSRPDENDFPFFIEGAQSLTWNDPAGDDNGGGNFIYPTGPYPSGSFDMRELTISWDEANVTFSITTRAMPSLSSHAVLPLGDIYIDINRLTGAGNTAALNKRLASLIHKNAAWEYAVSMTPNEATLFQSVPGGDPRVIQNNPSELSRNSFSTHFPRKFLRGDPRNWRISMALMGVENKRRWEDLVPIPVLSNATERAFGGAMTGRQAPPFIDLLSQSVDEQKEIISAYEAGGRITLPYVEAQ